MPSLYHFAFRSALPAERKFHWGADRVIIACSKNRVKNGAGYSTWDSLAIQQTHYTTKRRRRVRNSAYCRPDTRADRRAAGLRCRWRSGQFPPSERGTLHVERCLQGYRPTTARSSRVRRKCFVINDLRRFSAIAAAAATGLDPPGCCNYSAAALALIGCWEYSLWFCQTNVPVEKCRKLPGQEVFFVWTRG